jgi:hypothetical protein
MHSTLTPGLHLVRLARHFFMAVFFTVLLISCSDDDNDLPAGPTEYSGILVDVNGNPIPNHKVYLRRVGYGEPDWDIQYFDTTLILPNTPFGTPDSTFTSASGIFTFQYPAGVAPGELLNQYWPGVGNQDYIYCYTYGFNRSGPPPPIDSFYTEVPRKLSLTMRKSTAAHASDITLERIQLYNDNELFIKKKLFKGQRGITDFTIEIPYSAKFASRAFIEWKYNGDLPGKMGRDTIVLNPLANTSYLINY